MTHFSGRVILVRRLAGAACAPMDVELWPIGRLKPYENNPRDNDAAVEAVARQCRLHERTVYRRLDGPAFRARCRRHGAKWSSGRRGC